MAAYTVDFETTVYADDCRVWAWGKYGVHDGSFEYGNTIEGFVNTCFSGDTYYFHNLAFDGEFILNYLLSHGFQKHVHKTRWKEWEYETLIGKQGQFYSLQVQANGVNTKFYDSLKIIPLSISAIAKSFKLPEMKGEIDYRKKREPGHELTQEEVDYLRRDCTIAGQALKLWFEKGMSRITAGGNAFHHYKEMTGKRRFSRLFPQLECDEFLRKSYRGGFVYANPRYQQKDLKCGLVLDVNSLYPYVMYDRLLPYGFPRKFRGEYVPDEEYPLYIQELWCCFNIKDGMLPTIQLKNNYMFKPNEYLTTSNGEIVHLVMTSVDLKLFFEHYKVENIKWGDGYKFRARNDMFREYIDYWMDIKIKAGKEHNKGLRTLAKLMLNSLYGKFATNPKLYSKEPYLTEDGIRYKTVQQPDREPVYIPVGTFITAWARDKTIRTAQELGDRFCYADTDSCHILGFEKPEGVWIDDNELGAWKIEEVWRRARFIRAKCYLEVLANKEIKVTCAGMPANVKKKVTWTNFKIGHVFKGKLLPKHVLGGIVLVPGEFTIKE